MSVPEPISAGLAKWAAETYGAGSGVHDVAPLPGNAGLGFSFRVAHDQGETRLVIRLAAPGVPERGPNDVLRQVPLLRALDAAGIPVAPVVWSTADPDWFGSSAVISAFIAGRPLHTTRADLSADVPPEQIEDHVLAAVDVLADVHAVDWTAELAGWSEPAEPAEEIARWDRLFARAGAPEDAELAQRVSRALGERPPAASTVALRHGDYQTNNVLFEGGRITGVVDWELAGLGDPLLDVAWFGMFTDPACWAEDQQARMRVVVDPDAIARRYAEVTGSDLATLDWHRALSRYAFATITGFNLKLHRSGKRVDPTWEQYAGSQRPLLESAARLLRV